MQPKFSIVTVTYNCRDTIEKTIVSVLKQTYYDREYVIIDGGSTDGTVDIINSFRNKIDYFISEADHGIYDAMNKGIAAATGDWVIFMNAGDFFSDMGVLQRVAPLMDKDSTIVYGDIIKQCDGYYYQDKPAGVDQISVMMPVFHQATFVRLSYHKRHMFDTSFRSSGDYNFFYNCYYNDHCQFQYIPVTIACFDNTVGMSKDNHSLSQKENLRTWGKEHDNCFKFKQNINLSVFNIVKWLKQKVLGKKYSRKHEMKNLEKKGKIIILGNYQYNG